MGKMSNATLFPNVWGIIKSCVHLALRLATHPEPTSLTTADRTFAQRADSVLPTHAEFDDLPDGGRPARARLGVRGGQRQRAARRRQLQLVRPAQLRQPAAAGHGRQRPPVQRRAAAPLRSRRRVHQQVRVPGRRPARTGQRKFYIPLPISR